MGSPLSLSVDLCGHRLLFSKPLRLTSSPGLLAGVFHPSNPRRPSYSAPHPRLRTPSHCRSASSTSVSQNAAAPVRDGDFLSYLERNFSDEVLSSRVRNDGLGGSRYAQYAADELAPQLRGLPSSFFKLAEAIRLKDERKALIYLRRVAQLDSYDLQAGIAALPRAFFTEVFRLLDPFALSRTADPTSGVEIPRGMYTRLNLEATMDEWGVRKLYSRLLERLLILAEGLRASGYKLNNDEIKCLLRCAGASSEPSSASLIWASMVTAKTTASRDSSVYAEFIRARFMTEPLYSGWNKTLRMVIPRNLHRSRLLLSPRRVGKLDRLRYSLTVSKGLFGANKTVRHVEGQMRVMRKEGPVRRLFRSAIKEDISMTGDLACAFIIAFGRAGCLRRIDSEILARYYGLSVPGLEIRRAGDKGEEQVLPRTTFHQDRERVSLRPDERLMEAIVEAFGSNGEITMALDLVERISAQYNIPIPATVWTDLLEWTHVMGSRSPATMWIHAGLPSKIPLSHAVDVIWEKMRTSEPPIDIDFRQIAIMTKAHLGRGRRRDAHTFMRAAHALHKEQCKEFQEAGFEYIQSLRDGALSNHTIRRYDLARFHKQTQWYQLQLWCRSFLLKFRPIPRVDNDESNRVIPSFIEEFKEFVPNPLRYRTPTGYVFLLDNAAEIPEHVLVGHRMLDIPYKGRGQKTAVIRQVARRKTLVVSRRSLEGQWSARLKPHRILRAALPSFRTTGMLVNMPRPKRRRRETSMRQKQEQEAVLEDDDDYV